MLTNRAVPVAADTDGAVSDKPQITQSGGWKPETQGLSRLGPSDASVLHAPPASSKSPFSVHLRPCRGRFTRRPITKVRAAWRPHLTCTLRTNPVANVGALRAPGCRGAGREAGGLRVRLGPRAGREALSCADPFPGPQMSF